MMLLLVGVAVFGNLNIQEASSGFDAYRVEARTAVAANAADALVRDLQDKLSRFRLSLDAKYLVEVAKLIEGSRTYLGAAKAAERDPKKIEILNNQLDNIKKIVGLIDVMQKKITEATATVEKVMDPSALTINNTFTEMSRAANSGNNLKLMEPLDEAYTAFMELRVTVRKYIDLFDEKDAQQAELYRKSLATALEHIDAAIATPENRKKYTVLHASFQSYTKGFQTAHGLVRDGMTAQGQIDAIATSIVHTFNAYTADAEKTMNTIGPALEASNNNAQRLMTGVGIGGVVAGALLATWIIISIIRILNQVSSFAAQVAQGNFDATLQVHEGGEIGVMTSAMRQIPAELHKVMQQGRTLANNVAVGHFRERFDLTRFKGGFADLTACINSVGDAYTMVIDSMPSPMMTCDKNRLITFLNSSAQGIIGGNLVGKACGEILKAKECSSANCLGKQAMDKNVPIRAEVAICPDEKEIAVDVVCAALHDLNGDIGGFIEILTDMTEIKNAQTTMQKVARSAMSIADRVATASEELSAQVEQVSQGAEMQRARVENTATAMNEMNATVLEVARNASHASEQSEETRKKASGGSLMVDKVVQSINGVNAVAATLQNNMTELGHQAESIGNVMNVISDIADQTNLLALNAAIEAARAGEAGRGFAVVADEVRKLAEKTMEATHEVGSNIQAIQQSARTNITEVTQAVKNIGEATELANASGQALHEIVDLASGNSSVVASIATAAEEQSAASEEINTALEEVSRIVAETADGMVQSAAAVQDLSQTAQELKRVMERLRP